MFEATLSEISAALGCRNISSAELTACFLDRIDRLDARLNAFVTVCPEAALAGARAADARIARGEHGPLTGIPYANKDIFCTQGIRTTCGSRMLDNFVAPYDAAVVESLQAAGMVMLGKTNMDEFAMGSSNEASYYGATRNPWDERCVPGGSSGGSAAAVAARLVPFATGTDTGGSIRQPAAFCGVSGIKPTYGRVSRHGMIAYASSLDQGGAIGLSARDLALVMNSIAGHDARDSTSVPRPAEDFGRSLDDGIAGLRIGVPREFFDAGVSSGVGDRVNDAIDELVRQGATRVEVSLPTVPLSVPAYYVIAPAEASSNLARYDGVRYGYRCADPRDLLDMYERTRAEGFGDEVKRRILVGTFALSYGYFDAYYRKAQQIRRLVSDDFKRAWQTADVIVGPTAPTPAFRQGEKSSDPVAMYLCDVYTTPVNLAGLPGLSIPVGFHDDLPVGMQLIGAPFDEARLLQIAHQYQCATDWHRRIPPMATAAGPAA